MHVQSRRRISLSENAPEHGRGAETRQTSELQLERGPCPWEIMQVGTRFCLSISIRKIRGCLTSGSSSCLGACAAGQPDPAMPRTGSVSELAQLCTDSGGRRLENHQTTLWDHMLTCLSARTTTDALSAADYSHRLMPWHDRDDETTEDCFVTRHFKACGAKAMPEDTTVCLARNS